MIQDLMFYKNIYIVHYARWLKIILNSPGFSMSDEFSPRHGTWIETSESHRLHPHGFNFNNKFILLSMDATKPVFFCTPTFCYPLELPQGSERFIMIGSSLYRFIIIYIYIYSLIIVQLGAGIIPGQERS